MWETVFSILEVLTLWQYIHGVLSALSFFFGCCILLELAFRKKYLPKHIQQNFGKYIGRVFFSFPWTTFSWMKHIRNPHQIIDDIVILGCSPGIVSVYSGGPTSYIEKLVKQFQIRGIVNLQDEYSGEIDSYKKLDISQLYIPIVDHNEPPAEDLVKAVKWIEDFAKRKERVYVHCKGGHGRGGAVALAWKLYSMRKGPEDIGDEAVRERLTKAMSKARKVRTKLYSQDNVVNFVSWAKTQK